MSTNPITQTEISKNQPSISSLHPIDSSWLSGSTRVGAGSGGWVQIVLRRGQMSSRLAAAHTRTIHTYMTTVQYVCIDACGGGRLVHVPLLQAASVAGGIHDLRGAGRPCADPAGAGAGMSARTVGLPMSNLRATECGAAPSGGSARVMRARAVRRMGTARAATTSGWTAARVLRATGQAFGRDEQQREAHSDVQQAERLVVFLEQHDPVHGLPFHTCPPAARATRSREEPGWTCVPQPVQHRGDGVVRRTCLRGRGHLAASAGEDRPYSG